ncbi:MAG: DUF2142 domain-containing protein [Methanobrevibacter sp.]|nr:DUF2142 domain-containing protein [Candidatus Methanovirga procula]
MLSCKLLYALPYLGVAFVIKIGGLFNCSPLFLLYFGRFVNLLIYIVLVYFGIKVVPIGKYMFLLLALMPMSLYLSSSVSADSLNLALSFFTICLFLNLAFKDDKIHKKDIFFLSICWLFWLYEYSITPKVNIDIYMHDYSCFSFVF